MIYGERIRLRAVEREFLPLFVSWLNDPEVKAHLSIYLPFSQADEEGWYENMLKSPAESRPLTIEARQGEGWKTIGNCGLHQPDHKNRSAEFGLVIGDKTFWNHGYGTETTRLMVSHGFNTLNLHRIFLRVFENNPPAIRVYEKAGFIHEGRMRQAEYRDGEYIDVLLMSILRDEWRG